MSFSSALSWWKSEEVANISRFAGSLPPEWIEQSLRVNGDAKMRNRKLPADKTIWLVLGMALFGDRSILHVVEHLKLVVNGIIASSAITQARARLTSAPLKWLFARVAHAWSSSNEDKWRGLSLYGVDGSHQRVDGSHQRVADAKEVSDHFGRPKGRAEAGYPQLRFVALLNLTTRLLAGASVGKWTTGETTFASELWDYIPDNSLTIVDRGFLSYLIIFYVLSNGTNRHFLTRAKSNTKYTHKRILSDGTSLVTLKAPSNVLPYLEGFDSSAREIEMRAIAYQHRGDKPGVLLTSLVDEQAYPAAEILKLYHARWELEIAFDEIKTHMLDRKESLRSETVEGVYQEFWGILLVYNLIRREMHLVAQKKRLPANRISFTGAVLLVQKFFLLAQNSAPGHLPRELARLDEELGRSFVLPERKTDRRNPRQVKIKMSNYPKKPGRDVLAA
jgi:hypothetical protein